jgi:murein DD-endopeptidase MepM/ murein hydrolase activator NlpD
MRKHPILGYNKMHTGLDFGLPSGTPLRAAGDGIVSKTGRAGAYGIIVEIKHNKRTSTMFAHLSKLAPGIRPGVKVRQGQVVAYVGSTGRSTGPHAHYEVRIDGRPVNPAIMKASGSKQLAGKDLQKYKLYKKRVLALMQSAPSATQVAQAGQ